MDNLDLKKDSPPILGNLKSLKEQMERNGWVIEAFYFKYKNVGYVVLVKLYLEGEKKPTYALVKVEFVKLDDIQKRIVFPANSKGFMVDAKILRTFFEIEYSENIGDIIQRFYKYFSRFIPSELTHKTEVLKEHILHSLSVSDGENPDKIHCFSVKRNPKGSKRTPFNDNKTKILRPHLYSIFKEDKSISFCYSENGNDEKTDSEILLNFKRNNR
ncbi:DUF6037 family protein [Capnocytophaga stomatis]|uniref:DUF6037 family protein n=1 Tax=Capnocytophaga stomatis TaxID=1848904 RepID=UPI00385A6DB2